MVWDQQVAFRKTVTSSSHLLSKIFFGAGGNWALAMWACVWWCGRIACARASTFWKLLGWHRDDPPYEGTKYQEVCTLKWGRAPTNGGPLRAIYWDVFAHLISWSLCFWTSKLSKHGNTGKSAMRRYFLLEKVDLPCHVCWRVNSSSMSFLFFSVLPLTPLRNGNSHWHCENGHQSLSMLGTK